MKYAREFGLDLDLTKPNTTCQVVCTGDEIIDNKIPDTLKNAITSRLQQEVMDQKWQGEITAARWKDQDLSLKECYTWLKGWKAAPTHTIAGIEELHQQLLPTKIYHQKKTGFNTTDIMCRMCGEKPESLAHVIAGYGVLAQTKYLSIHNAALKIPFFEMLNDMELIESTPPWYSLVQPKPVYQNDRAESYWDVPVYAESTVVKSNRVNVRLVDKEKKEVLLVEMTYPWIGNRVKIETEKTTKYAPLRWEMKDRYPGYVVKQINIIVDVLGGYRLQVRNKMKELFREKRARECLMKM